MAAPNHAIDYIEFPVTDMEATKTFYASAFGWSFTDYAPSYVGIQKQGGGEMGGFRLEEKIESGGPLVVLYSTNIEDSLEKVKAAKGQITKPIFKFPGGQRFEFKDPNGNNLAIWSK